MAYANTHITSAAIEATEFMDLARSRVTGVPKTIVNETIEIPVRCPKKCSSERCCRFQTTPRRRQPRHGQAAADPRDYRFIDPD